MFHFPVCHINDLVLQEVKPGVGHCIPDGASVTFHYSAFLEYSDEPFDSTMLREQPERKLLDAGEMLPGLNIAIKTMRRGEKSRFLIQPQYAFGEVRYLYIYFHFIIISHFLYILLICSIFPLCLKPHMNVGSLNVINAIWLLQ